MAATMAAAAASESERLAAQVEGLEAQLAAQLAAGRRFTEATEAQVRARDEQIAHLEARGVWRAMGHINRTVRVSQRAHSPFVAPMSSSAFPFVSGTK